MSSWRATVWHPVVWIAAGLLGVQVLMLILMRHPLICTCGHIELWHAALSGPQTSQHLSDWYSFTHLEHGLLLYGLLRLARPNAAFATVLGFALGVEVLWEIVENSPWVIERYRQTALAAGYFGDSVINSLGDTGSMMLGVVLARVLPVRLSIALIIVIECGLAALIHDNLTLNIIQLIHPLQMVADWQSSV